MGPTSVDHCAVAAWSAMLERTSSWPPCTSCKGGLPSHGLPLSAPPTAPPVGGIISSAVGERGRIGGLGFSLGGSDGATLVLAVGGAVPAGGAVDVEAGHGSASSSSSELSSRSRSLWQTRRRHAFFLIPGPPNLREGGAWARKMEGAGRHASGRRYSERRGGGGAASGAGRMGPDGAPVGAPLPAGARSQAGARAGHRGSRAG